jgi:WD40 repeat protein
MNYQTKQKLDNGHNDGIWSFAWSQGNIVSGSIDGIVKHWNLSDGKPSFVSKKHKVGVTSLVALQDGSMAIACYQDSVIRFFDLITKSEKFTLNQSSSTDKNKHNSQESSSASSSTTTEGGLFDAFSLALSPGEDILVSGTTLGMINIWSMQSDEHEKIASIPSGNNGKFILNTCFSVDGKLSISSVDGSITIFDMNTQKLLHRLDTLHVLPVRTCAFSPNGDLLYTGKTIFRSFFLLLSFLFFFFLSAPTRFVGSDDRQIHILDLKSGKIVSSFSNDSMILSLDTSQDNRHFIAGNHNSKVMLFDLGMRKKVQTFTSHNDAVWCVKYDNSSQSHHSSSSSNGAMMLDEGSSGVDSGNGGRKNLSFGERFASSSDDSTIQLYEFA